MGDVFNSKLYVENGKVVAFGGLGVPSFDGDKKRPWDAGPSRSWGGRVSRRFENEYG